MLSYAVYLAPIVACWVILAAFLLGIGRAIERGHAQLPGWLDRLLALLDAPEGRR